MCDVVISTRMAEKSCTGAAASEVRQDRDLVAAAMTRQLSVSLGRRISLDDLSDNCQNDSLVDSPQNGDVDVVTVDNGPEQNQALAAEKHCPASTGMFLP